MTQKSTGGKICKFRVDFLQKHLQCKVVTYTVSDCLTP